MTPDRWPRIQELFTAANEREPEARAEFLEEACGGDSELKREVESLLSSLGAASPSFLESPAIADVRELSPKGRAGSPSLARGTRLGPYEILAPLGSGGMGEVYRARDERLAREVAIKVLPAELSLDTSRLKRFEKEARSASALNHPNIITIYDIGESQGTSFIAMELVDGQTLRQMLNPDGLPAKRLLPIAVQVAEGLARAHEAGIVHRDLKPENVMVTRDGLVKVLDFGLAKLTSAGSGSGEGGLLPRASETTPGVVVGTVGYMSPEQASGEPVDFRSDQFSLGSILYEMATGKRAFDGKTGIDTLGAILNDEPQPIAELKPQSPAPLRWIVGRCLAKERRQRYSSTDDLARELATLRDHLSEATSGRVLAGPRPRRRLVAALAAVGVAALGVTAIRLMRPGPSAALRPIRFSIRRPPGADFGGGLHNFELSPDGSQLAFRADSKIWLRPLSSEQARVVPGPEDVDSLFWSPDSRSIGFFAAGKLWRVDLSGGAPVAICDVVVSPGETGHVGSWGANGQIVLASDAGQAIFRISTSGGAPVAIVKPDRARGQLTVTWPWFLPDGRSFLYVLREEGDKGTLMLSPPAGPARPLTPVLSRVEYTDPGLLVFVRDGTLIAQGFDPRSGRLAGEPFSIADSVRYGRSEGFAGFTTSRSGGLAFRRPDTPRGRIGWFDRSGRLIETLSSPGFYGDIALDPEGRRILFDRSQPKNRARNLWILDLDRKIETRLTTDANDEYGGTWLPDGKSITYFAQSSGLRQLRRRELAAGKVEAIFPYGALDSAKLTVFGGGQILYTSATAQGKEETRLVALSGNLETSALVETSPYSGVGVFSPDGRFMIMGSDTGSDTTSIDDIDVVPVATPGAKIRISTGGTAHSVARWSRDGSEILYVSTKRQLVSVPIRTAPPVSVGKPTVLFTFKEGEDWDNFDVSPDGKRFVATFYQGPAEEVPINVVLNWTSEIAAHGGAAK